ncbi:BamA/TamA family outer membrane protein [Iningainema tapete]|uniref:BamA/TamA family outer membrane protein n=1 Tax=Iningainema tapete BLCC-T55 TaxID=2748662 RepID=A0A8J6XJU5_9CYAN|nr:BamA/TamA family outer membrane protein [Iningainema tapete]MBD2775883.1 BamA/TamA family outer membrane protein [Iningainema tapete BLCC-T55]
MRVQVVFLIAVMLVLQKNQEVLASESSQSAIPLTQTEQEVDNSEQDNNALFQRVVKDVQIRFINNKGKLVDDKDQPIKGRTQKDFIIGNLKLKPGEVFSSEILEKDLQRLRRLNSLVDVQVSWQEDDGGVNIIYDIKERKSSVNFGGGDSGDFGLYGQVGYEDTNINGLNDQLGTTVQVSGEGVQFDSQYTSPYRHGEPNRLGYSIKAFRNRDLSRTFTDDIKLANDSAVREGRFGGSIGLLKSFDDWDTAVALNYTRISLRDRDYNVAQVDRLGSPLSLSGTGIDDLVTVSVGLTRDERDRRENPTQGSLFTFSTEQSIPIGLGNIVRNRVRANYIQYVPVSWIGNGRKSDNPEMLAFNLQAGTTVGDFPPAEAFDLGGLNSVRGYGGGKVASGRSYGLASVEYRFPIFQSVGGVFFADFASDFGTSKTVLGEPGILRGKPGSGFGYGLGLRVKSPFGLLRGDLGISDQGEVRFDITTGQRF